MTFDWAGIVEQEGAALGDAAGMDHGAPVPATPGWDTTELLRHVGLVHARTSVILRTGTMERPSRANGMLPEPPGEEILDWYRTTLAEVVADLRALEDPDRPVYAFSPSKARTSSGVSTFGSVRGTRTNGTCWRRPPRRRVDKPRGTGFASTPASPRATRYE